MNSVNMTSFEDQMVRAAREFRRQQEQLDMAFPHRAFEKIRLQAESMHLSVEAALEPIRSLNQQIHTLRDGVDPVVRSIQQLRIQVPSVEQQAHYQFQQLRESFTVLHEQTELAARLATEPFRRINEWQRSWGPFIHTTRAFDHAIQDFFRSEALRRHKHCRTVAAALAKQSTDGDAVLLSFTTEELGLPTSLMTEVFLALKSDEWRESEDPYAVIRQRARARRRAEQRLEMKFRSHSRYYFLNDTPVEPAQLSRPDENHIDCPAILDLHRAWVASAPPWEKPEDRELMLRALEYRYRGEAVQWPEIAEILNIAENKREALSKKLRRHGPSLLEHLSHYDLRALYRRFVEEN